MKKFIAIAISSLMMSSAFASFKGEYKLETSSGDEKCNEDIRVNTQVNENEKTVSVTLETLDGRYFDHFSEDLHIEFVEDDTGTIGYNREGGIVTEHRASDVQTSTGFALILFGLPVHFSEGSTLKLSHDGNKLTLKSHDTIYGFGKRTKCIYKRTK